LDARVCRPKPRISTEEQRYEFLARQRDATTVQVRRTNTSYVNM